jgi:D-sedoheptulose 7-phosphate isomerase
MTLSNFIADYTTGFTTVIAAIDPAAIEQAALALREAFDAGKQIFIAGNGGSAATASHMACDLAKTTLGKARQLPARRIRAIALTDNVPLLTAWGNDVSYDCVFAEQLRNLANPGDTLVLISASGNSPNIVEAAKAARELGLRTVGLLGFEGGAVRGMVERAVVVRSTHFGYIEDAHSVISHLITDTLKQPVQAG